MKIALTHRMKITLTHINSIQSAIHIRNKTWWSCKISQQYSKLNCSKHSLISSCMLQIIYTDCATSSYSKNIKEMLFCNWIT
jgi:hypothetical protein